MRNIRITYNQIELLDTIQSFRFLPLKILVEIAIRKKLYSFRQSVSKVVGKLERENLIKSFYYGNNWKVVYITKAGAKMLADSKGTSTKNFPVPNQGKKVQFAMLEHTVKIASLYREFVTELINYPEVELQKWLGDQRIMCQYQFRSNRKARTLKRNLNPDSYFHVQVQGRDHHYFLEYDTGSMDKEQLAHKFMRYFEYFVYGNWEKRFQHYPSILFITDRAKEKIESMLKPDKKTLEQALNSRDYFTGSSNLLWTAIGLSDNTRSIGSYKIRTFLEHEFTFTYTNTKWTKKLLEQLV